MTRRVGSVRRGLVALLSSIAMLCAAAPTTADAATPARGTLSKKVRSVRWKGTFTLSQPNPVTGDCIGGATDPICDHFLLKVDLPDGARIRVSVPMTDEPGDLDMHVYAPDGSLVGSGTKLQTNEAVEFRHRGRFRGKSYEVRVVPWIVVPGTTYDGTAVVR